MTADPVRQELECIARREGLPPDELERQVLATFVASYGLFGRGLPVWASIAQPLPIRGIH